MRVPFPPARGPGSICRAAFLLALASLVTTLPAHAAERRACLAETGVPSARLAVLARGFNLTGWLDGDAPRRPQEATLAALRTRLDELRAE